MALLSRVILSAVIAGAALIVLIGNVKGMKLTSTVFTQGGSIPSKYTCDGGDVSPPLQFVDVPSEAKSLALIMDDPDVPSSVRPDNMWDHWVVFNIPPSVTEIPEGVEPEGVHGVGTSGNTAYHGPCPPDREHRYFFKLYALDAMLDLPANTSKQDVLTKMQGHIIEETQLVGRYNRQ